MAEVSVIYLVDGADGRAVEAELRDAIEQPEIDDWVMKWQPAMLAVLQELVRRGVTQWPQSWHWNWADNRHEALTLGYWLRPYGNMVAASTF
jgi:hypothetical protein